MSAEEEKLLKLLQDKDLLIEQEDIQRVVNYAVRQETTLEISLDHRKEAFLSHLYHPRKECQEPIQPGVLLLHSMEPPTGNLKIRQSSRVNLQFIINTLAVECKVNFISVITHDSIPLICVSYPQVLQVHSRRSSYRYPIFDELACKIYIEPRGHHKSVNGILKDIHMEGICFMADELREDLAKGERIHVAIKPTMKELATTINCYGRICYNARVRNGANKPVSMCGLEISNIDEFLLMRKLFMMIKEYEPPTQEPDLDLDALIAEVFGD
ncbi:PilZ domain-containing protein [Magnetococcales bacterium HHB-1]